MNKLLFTLSGVVIAGGGLYLAIVWSLASRPVSTITYVGPYSPEAYQAASIIKQGGAGTPFNATIIDTAHVILSKQP